MIRKVTDLIGSLAILAVLLCWEMGSKPKKAEKDARDPWRPS